MSQREAYSTPRWVKVVGIIIIVLILLVIVVLVTDIGGEHGPDRHIPSGEPVGTLSDDLASHTPAIEDRGQQP